ncbi:MAG: helix-hairpin-helix domain-containing protein, partial [Trueperaceae bacterium]
LIELAGRNARNAVDAELARLERRGEAPGVKELTQALELKEPAWRIEGYDVSNLMGSHTVASIVAFEGGRPKRSDYRSMRIRDLDKPDDFFSLHQALVRRFTGRLAERLPEPDLLLIDGGKGQVSSARRALREAGITVPIVGLAKRAETLIREDGRELHLPLTHPALRLLVHVRDEAHRVAVGGNRTGRGRAATKSVLDEVSGIGPKRRDALLASFSSVDQLLAADEATLAAVPGVGRSAAAAVRSWARRELELVDTAAADRAGSEADDAATRDAKREATPEATSEATSETTP